MRRLPGTLLVTFKFQWAFCLLGLWAKDQTAISSISSKKGRDRIMYVSIGKIKEYNIPQI
jgi:hypothetical protein